MTDPYSITKRPSTAVGPPNPRKLVLDWVVQQAFGKAVDLVTRGAQYTYDNASQWLKDKLGMLDKGDRDKFPGDGKGPSTTMLPAWEHLSNEQRATLQKKYGDEAKKVVNEYNALARAANGTPIFDSAASDEMVSLLFMLSTLKRVAYAPGGASTERTLTIDEAGLMLRRIAAVGPLTAAGALDTAIATAKSVGNVPDWMRREAESGTSDAFGSYTVRSVALRNNG